jgi:hypothetical protein
VKDTLGRLWKVGNAKEGGQFVLVCYTKLPSGMPVIQHELDIASPGVTHASRVRKGGMACGGQLYGTPGFQICKKCAALVDDRRR